MKLRKNKKKYPAQMEKELREKLEKLYGKPKKSWWERRLKYNIST